MLLQGPLWALSSRLAAGIRRALPWLFIELCEMSWSSGFICSLTGVPAPKSPLPPILPMGMTEEQILCWVQLLAELEMPKIRFLFVWRGFFLKYSVSGALNVLKNEVVKCLKILFYVSKQTFILSFITLVKLNVLFILYISIFQKMF